MTRINCVPVTELCNKHLFAEWRELPRIQSYLNKSLKKDIMKTLLCEVPPRYTLGSGHVKFFYNKLYWILNRYDELTSELLQRGYNIEPRQLEINAPLQFWNNWKPTGQDMKTNRERIKERLPQNPKYGSIK